MKDLNNIKIGDSIESVLKKLGQPQKTLRLPSDIWLYTWTKEKIISKPFFAIERKEKKIIIIKINFLDKQVLTIEVNEKDEEK